MPLFFLFFSLMFTSAAASHVISVTSASKCSTCDSWNAWMSTIQDDRPWMNIHHYDFFKDFDVLASFRDVHGGQMKIPTAFYIDDNDETHAFEYGRSKGLLRRWMQDVDNGIFELIPQIKPNDGFEEQHRLFMEIISTERPETSHLIKSLPSVGFGWFPLIPPKSVTMYIQNTTIVKGLNAMVTVQHELPLNASLLPRLLPPITSYSVLDSDLKTTVNEILSALATVEVHLISDNPLPSWWLAVSAEYPDYGFVHRNSTESGLPSPSTMTFRRQMEFITATVSNRTWLTEVYAGNVAPVRRPSKMPSNTVEITEVSGDTLSNWVAAHPDGVLYFYNGKDEMCRNAVGTGTGVGRMMIPYNDHELFSSALVKNTAVRFSAGRPLEPKLCSDWEEMWVDKEEL